MQRHENITLKTVNHIRQTHKVQYNPTDLSGNIGGHS